MPKPRDYQTEAIIIRKTRLGEADRILSLYTPHLGKIEAVAKGVRRPRSKLSGHLELLTHSQVSLARGRNLDTITGSQTIDSFLPIKSDLELTSGALYAAELVGQFTADHIENYPLFRLLLDTLHRLSRGDNAEMALRYFELYLLHEVGYRPELRQCVGCRRPLQPTTNAFSAGAGGMVCPDCASGQLGAYPVSVDALKVLRFIQDNSYDTACRLKVPPALAAELEAIIRRYLCFLLEREVRSAAWRDALRQ